MDFSGRWAGDAADSLEKYSVVEVVRC